MSLMAAIQAATLNAARTFKKDKNDGIVEPGKVADVSIVESDPLQDIWATQNVKMVVMDGKFIDIGFTKYKNPIPSFYSYQLNSCTQSCGIEFSQVSSRISFSVKIVFFLRRTDHPMGFFTGGNLSRDRSARRLCARVHHKALLRR